MSANISDPLLNLVRERGLIDDLQLEEVMQENNKSGKDIGQILRTRTSSIWTPSLTSSPSTSAPRW